MKTSLRLAVAALGLAVLNISAVKVQAQFNYIVTNGTVTITGYTGPGGDVTIPSTKNGLPVTSIRDWAFSGCTSLTSITIPNGVTSIGDGAFSGCTSLTGIVIPDSVTSVGSEAFFNCSSLQNITIGNGVTSIGYLAFADCTSLTNATISGNVSRWETWDWVSGTGQEGTARSGEEIDYSGSYAFSGCTNLNSVTIGEGVQSIPAYLFSRCNRLTAVYVKGNAPSILLHAFDGATNATRYFLPGTTGWGPLGTPWVLPYPLILSTTPSFGIRSNQFGFRISWATNASVVVEASAGISNPIWTPVSTNTLSNGWSYFSDSEWTNYPVRFYRIRSL